MRKFQLTVTSTACSPRLRTEIGMTPAGMNWPAGGSRVVAAHSV
jgi:hypothetical protein